MTEQDALQSIRDHLALRLAADAMNDLDRIMLLLDLLLRDKEVSV